jgi:hypothetical protein
MSRRITLSRRAQQYLTERRRLGFQSRRMGDALRSFTGYVDRLERHGPITLEVMAEWARRDHQHSTDPRTSTRRLATVQVSIRTAEPATQGTFSWQPLAR